MAGSSDAYKSYRGQIPNTANYKTDLPESVHQRMMRANEMATKRANARKAAAAPVRPAGSIDLRGYFGDERTGIRKTAGQKIASALKAGVVDKKAKPADVVRTTTDMKTTPARMAVNPRTGSTLGFTTGKVTGSTASKSGVAMRTPMTAGQRTARAALEKGGVAGPSKTASGKNASFGFGGGKGGKKK
jgi:hypothetical protein